MAFLDKDYRFIGVFNKRSGNKYTFSDKNLDKYFILKKPREITREYLLKTPKGIGYTKSPASYLFIKVS